MKRPHLKLRREAIAVLRGVELRHAVGGASGEPCHNGGVVPAPAPPGAA